MPANSELLPILKDFINNTPRWYCRFRWESSEIQNLLFELTDFLPQDSPLVRRGWHVVNGLYKLPICNHCNKENSYFRKRNLTYSDYCYKCIKIIEQKNREKANIEKYGEKTALINPEVREKTKKTNLEKYGTEYSSSSDIVKNKVKDTLIKRYGVTNVSQLDSFKEKKRNTLFKNYGVLNPMQSLELQNRKNLTNIKKYGVENPMQSYFVKEKVRQTSLELWNRDNHVQKNIDDHNMEILNCKESLIKLHHTQKLSQGEIGNILSINQTTVSMYLKRHGIETKYYYRSKAEKEIFEFISNFVYAEANNRKAIGTELDIFIPSYNLAIEYCGLYWHGEKKRKEYAQNIHEEKYKKCKDRDIRLITIFEDEWVNKPNLVKKKLLNILECNDDKKIYARKCQLKQIPKKEKSNFLNQFHIQGDGPSSINYGLFYNNTLIACIGFNKKKDYYILNRYATSCNVAGGFGKLLTYFERIHSHPTIVTFADLRWSDGYLFQQCGFAIDEKLKPDYFWCNNTNRWHKRSWKHSNMKQKLKNYDPLLTESENMYAHNYYKIWDCGSMKFIKNNT